jgi:hypothetical protein
LAAIDQSLGRNRGSWHQILGGRLTARRAFPAAARKLHKIETVPFRAAPSGRVTVRERQKPVGVSE